MNKGEAEVLFLLDAYDELSAGYISKSLYQANNLEQFRSHAERAANEYSHPSWLRGGPALSDDSASTAGRFRILGVAGQMADRKRELETFDQQAPKGHLHGALRAALRRGCARAQRLRAVVPADRGGERRDGRGARGAPPFCACGPANAALP